MKTNAENTGAGHYLRPLGFLTGTIACRAINEGVGVPLAGGPTAFTHVEEIRRAKGGLITRQIRGVNEVDKTLLDPLTRSRPPLRLRDGRHMDLTSPVIFGIVNVTPDSFSDGGQHADAAAAIAHGRAMMAAGAHILDIGGESTRPGAAPVDADREQRRILPVIEGLRDAGAILSVDTRRSATMAAAVAAGAVIINDVTALTFDPNSVGTAAASEAAVILMHAQGEPPTMQQDPRYDDVVLDVYDYLHDRVEAAIESGIPRSRIVVDPGIGFGKTLSHNLALLDAIGIFHGLGCAVMLGVSRKSMIGRIAREDNPERRVPGSLALAVMARTQGVQVFRVHDVGETVQALGVAEALLVGGQGGPMPHG